MNMGPYTSKDRGWGVFRTVAAITAAAAMFGCMTPPAKPAAWQTPAEISGTWVQTFGDRAVDTIVVQQTGASVTARKGPVNYTGTYEGGVLALESHADGRVLMRRQFRFTDDHSMVLVWQKIFDPDTTPSDYGLSGPIYHKQ